MQPHPTPPLSPQKIFHFISQLKKGKQRNRIKNNCPSIFVTSDKVTLVVQRKKYKSRYV